MHGLSVVVGVAVLLCSTLSHSQQGLVGTYTGQFLEPQAHGTPKPQYVILEIAKAENGKLAGKVNLANFDCRGDYVVEGAYEGDKLRMQTSEGTLRGCGLQDLILTVQGGKLVGSFGRPQIEFSRK